jgi:hypothetical protein
MSAIPLLASCGHGVQDAIELAEGPDHDTSGLASVLTGPEFTDVVKRVAFLIKEDLYVSHKVTLMKVSNQACVLCSGHKL